LSKMSEEAKRGGGKIYGFQLALTAIIGRVCRTKPSQHGARKEGYQVENKKTHTLVANGRERGGGRETVVAEGVQSADILTARGQKKQQPQQQRLNNVQYIFGH